MDATLALGMRNVRAVYHQQLKCLALYNSQSEIMRHLMISLNIDNTASSISPCARYLAIKDNNGVTIVDFIAKKTRYINACTRTVFWCRFGEVLLGVLSPIEDRIWLYKGIDLVVEISAHGQIDATQADIVNDAYLVLSNDSQRQVFRLSSFPDIDMICQKYTLLDEIKENGISMDNFNESVSELSQLTFGLDILGDVPCNLKELNDAASQALGKIKTSFGDVTFHFNRMLVLEDLAKPASHVLDKVNAAFENALLIGDWLACWDHARFVTKSWSLRKAFVSLADKSSECSLLNKAIEMLYEKRNFSVFLTTNLRQ